MIYYAMSEVREGSLAAVKAALEGRGQPIGQLEEYTGADFLISPLAAPRLPFTITDAIPHQLALRMHCEAGWLVQRKSGRDAVSSIPEYARILDKMRSWSPQCWLLLTGSFSKMPNGHVRAGGIETGFDWKAFHSCLENWQLDGGYVASLDVIDEFGDWLDRVQARLIDWHEHGRETKIIEPRQGSRDVLGDGDEAKRRGLLAALPGIGPKRAVAALERWGDLAAALMWLSSPELFDLTPDSYPDGIGPGTVKAIHDFLGAPLLREPESAPEELPVAADGSLDNEIPY